MNYSVTLCVFSSFFVSNMIANCYGTSMLRSSVVSLVLIKTLILFTAAVNITILTVPKPGSSMWVWQSSGSRPIPWKQQSSPVIRYEVCDSDQANAWLRSDVFQVNDAKRVDVTVDYAAINCSILSNYKNCQANLKLSVHKAAVEDRTIDKIGYIGPNPATKPQLFELFGTTNSKVLTETISKPENTETYSFNTNPAKSYYYLAIQYTGGCYALFGISISYSVCPSLALRSSLVKLPQTTSPANGSIQVTGSCPAHSQPMAKNVTLCGYCKADGEWSTNMYSGECWCDAGYGKYSVGQGAECKECPAKTYQNTPSNSKCKDCPVKSVQDTNRTKCKCLSEFYRTEKESISENCTAQPSAPRELAASFLNATLMAMKWSPPLDLGGRSDVYYEAECKQCNEKGQDCTKDCTGAVIIHTTRTTRMATVKHLSAYMYYQIKVFAKNEVTSLAEKINEKAKYATLVKRTKESVPGTPLLQVKVLNPTSVLLTWILQETNGVIAYYQVTYYPDGEELRKKILKTRERSITITDLQPSNQYVFEVQAATSIGMGTPNKSLVITLQKKTSNKSNDNKVDVTIPILATIVCLALFIIAVIIAVYIKRKRHSHQERTRTEDTNDASTVRKKTNNNFPEGNIKLQKLCIQGVPDQADDFDGFVNEVVNDLPERNVNLQQTLNDELSHQTDGIYAVVTNDITWEVQRENLSVIKRLGSGNFGYVDKALAIGLPGFPGQVTVAVKTLKQNARDHDKEDFVTELTLMKKLQPHPHIVRLLGCCTNSQGPMSIILEYLPYGDLLGYLRRSRGHEDTYCSGDRRPEGSLSSRELLKFAWMISDGMKFLADNKCVHRDLAARNVLVGENKLCKISDLGLARTVREDVYTRSKSARLPIKWMPPESVFFGKSSIDSDVWSYGIVLYEIFTLGDSPYPKYKGKDIPRLLQTGYRMPKPNHLSENLYTLMLRCWEEKPEDRPSFSSICDEINAFYNATMDYINLDAFDEAQYVNFDVL